VNATTPLTVVVKINDSTFTGVYLFIFYFFILRDEVFFFF
jgi:hypothetical protein